jgi:hypothetical protein
MMTKKTTTKKPTTTAKGKAAKPKAKPVATEPAKKISQIQAALQVLAKSKEPMNCQAMVEAMTARGLWTSPGGKTPHATLYASILREINAKGKDARFKKVDRGQFVATGSEA